MKMRKDFAKVLEKMTEQMKALDDEFNELHKTYPEGIPDDVFANAKKKLVDLIESTYEKGNRYPLRNLLRKKDKKKLLKSIDRANSVEATITSRYQLNTKTDNMHIIREIQRLRKIDQEVENVPSEQKDGRLAAHFAKIEPRR